MLANYILLRINKIYYGRRIAVHQDKTVNHIKTLSIEKNKFWWQRRRR